MLYPHETLIKEAYGVFGKRYNLVHVPECDEVAGSGTRHIKECWRVVYMFDGNRHSKAFATLEAAQNELDTWTMPIVAIPVKARKPAYGEKRDYPKIDIYAHGIYQCSTTWAATCKEAREHYKSPTGGNAKITARFAKESK